MSILEELSKKDTTSIRDCILKHSNYSNRCSYLSRIYGYNIVNSQDLLLDILMSGPLFTSEESSSIEEVLPAKESDRNDIAEMAGYKAIRLNLNSLDIIRDALYDETDKRSGANLRFVGFTGTLESPVDTFEVAGNYRTEGANVSEDNIVGNLIDVGYGTYEISLENVTGATLDAKSSNIEIGGVGTITVTFSVSQLVATVNHVLEKDTQGVDINKDGVIDIPDVQIIANNLEV